MLPDGSANEFQGKVAVMCDRAIWQYRDWSFVLFGEATPEILAAFDVIILYPRRIPDVAFCEEVLDWKRDGRLEDTKLVFGAFYGRHICSTENDALVHRWAVHAKSEREVLESDKLFLLPYCVQLPNAQEPSTDEGYIFTGGRTFRQFQPAVEALSRSRLPGKMISDLAPPGDFPGVDINRSHVSGEEYTSAMRRARAILVPLIRMPISHGHRDVVTAIMLGKPVVVTAGASCEDYVTHGVNGLLVPSNSVEAWQDAIMEVNERAEEFAAAAREMASRYDQKLVPAYLDETLAHPDRHIVTKDTERARAQAPVAEWEHLRQEIFYRREKQRQRDIVDEARTLLRDKQYAEAIEKARDCLQGHFRPAALGITKNAQLRMTPESAEPILREIIEELGETAELRTDLSKSLAAQQRFAEALAEAQRGVELDPAREASASQLNLLKKITQKREAQVR